MATCGTPPCPFQLADFRFTTPEFEIDDVPITGVLVQSADLATGTIATPGEHPLLYNLYYGLRTVLATDAQGVMGTTLPAERASAERMIADFKAGNTALTIDGKPTRYADITDPAIRDRFKIEQLDAWAEQYRLDVIDSDLRDAVADVAALVARLAQSAAAGDDVELETVRQAAEELAKRLASAGY